MGPWPWLVPLLLSPDATADAPVVAIEWVAPPTCPSAEVVEQRVRRRVQPGSAPGATAQLRITAMAPAFVLALDLSNSRLRAARAAVANDLDRLHAPQPIDLGTAIVATRPRAAVAPERARRVWAAVLAKVAIGGGEVAVATTGLALWKIAIAAVATIGGGTWALLPESPPTAAVIAPSLAPAEPIVVADEVPSIEAHVAPATPAPLEEIDRPTPARRVTVPDPPPATPPVTDTVADEVAALDRARALLRAGDAEAALAELDRYTARFTNGRLQLEAAGTRVAALCKVDRDDDARTLARTFGLPTPSC